MGSIHFRETFGGLMGNLVRVMRKRNYPTIEEWRLVGYRLSRFSYCDQADQQERNGSLLQGPGGHASEDQPGKTGATMRCHGDHTNSGLVRGLLNRFHRIV